MSRDDAPRTGCHCMVCRWLRDNAVSSVEGTVRPGTVRPGTVRPGTVEWDHLMRAAGAGWTR